MPRAFEFCYAIQPCPKGQGVLAALGLKSAGLDVLCLPDTAGVILPGAYRWMISTVLSEVKTDLSVHCHDDLGMAVANVLAGVEAGANIVEVTVNGLGDRTGNPELIVTTLLLQEVYGYDFGYDFSKAMELAKKVEEYSGIPIGLQRPIVGDFSFVHESGIHVHAQQRACEAYEALNPAAFGRKSETVLGKHSGKSAVYGVLREEGVDPTFEELRELTFWVKSKAEAGRKVDKKKLLQRFNEVRKRKKKSTK